jgi:hypothetical protein
VEEIAKHLDTCHVLRPQAGVLALCADAGYFNGPAGYRGKRYSGAQYLAAALSLRAVDPDRFCQRRTDCDLA